MEKGIYGFFMTVLASDICASALPGARRSFISHLGVRGELTSKTEARMVEK